MKKTPDPKLWVDRRISSGRARQPKRATAAELRRAVRASLDTEVKAGDGDSRTLTFTISSAAVDRMGDTIKVDGWKLDAYRKNPVVLWGHDAGDFPSRRPKDLDRGRQAQGGCRVHAGGQSGDRQARRRHPAALQGRLPLGDVGRFQSAEVRLYGRSEAPLRHRLPRAGAAGIFLRHGAGQCRGADRGPRGRHRCDADARLVRRPDQALRRQRAHRQARRSVLGGKGEDLVALAWAERIIEANGKSLVPAGSIIVRRASRASARMRSPMEAAATRERLRKKRQRDLDVAARARERIPRKRAVGDPGLLSTGRLERHGPRPSSDSTQNDETHVCGDGGVAVAAPLSSLRTRTRPRR
jgi:hypothetical protein